jgi:uncharacterized protein (DUF1330 family)
MPIDSVTKVLESLDHEGPIDMVNGLKFHKTAQYPEDSGEPRRSGREAFAVYRKLLDSKLKLMGGTEPIWRGRVHYEITEDGTRTCDQIMVIRFPSKTTLVSLPASPEFARIHVHRAADLSESRSYICTSA